jgi:hypothetical protein
MRLSARMRVLAGGIILGTGALAFTLAAGRPGSSAAHRSAGSAAFAKADARRPAGDARGLDPATRRTIATFRGPNGDAFDIVTAKRTGHAQDCVIGRFRGTEVGSCASDLFRLHPVHIVESFSGGPGGKPRRDYELFGVAEKGIARVEVVDTAGDVTTVMPTSTGAIFFTFDTAALEAGVAVRELRAYDAGGARVARIPVGDGS